MKKLTLALAGLLAFSSCIRPVTEIQQQHQSLQLSKLEYVENIQVSDNLPAHALYEQTILPYKLKLDEKMNVKISSTTQNLSKRGTNSQLGNLLADMTFEGGDEWLFTQKNIHADAAVINIGGIRAEISAGDILVRHIYEVMPFDNELVIVKMTGKAMQKLVEYYKKTQKNNPVSRLYIETKDNLPTIALVNGKAFDEHKDYYIVTSDYVALGGDNMNFFADGELISTNIKFRDLYLEKFAQRNPLVLDTLENRLNFSKNATPKTNSNE